MPYEHADQILTMSTAVAHANIDQVVRPLSQIWIRIGNLTFDEVQAGLVLVALVQLILRLERPQIKIAHCFEGKPSNLEYIALIVSPQRMSCI